MEAGHGLTDVPSRLPKTREAVVYAKRRHAGQRRSTDGAPLIVHPLEVGALLEEAERPDDVIAAGVLHDVIEKTDASPDEIRRRFGSRVATLVLAVTEDRSIADYAARKAALRRQVASAGEEALSVFAADKISKVRELERLDGELGRTHARNLRHYRASLELLEKLLPDASLTRRLREELGRLPARAGADRSLTRAS